MKYILKAVNRDEYIAFSGFAYFDPRQHVAIKYDTRNEAENQRDGWNEGLFTENDKVEVIEIN